ncbi:hypothetical protein BC936DRAFT_148080 [Jimgerdemannia flammicorona]|uniref:Calcineurin-like phosphoesterase domain-containing protein n=1 Tax=Jimgerdemannia flammicorona TaxID=994334 RepID=A0A433D3U6_9FUNG|nr:hypothetical protein BC936DRAFT_148080 [Jimgerdemannia flammicorona]
MRPITAVLFALLAMATTTTGFGTLCQSASRRYPTTHRGGADPQRVFRGAPRVLPNLHARNETESTEPEWQATPPNLKVAFFGDQGIGDEPRAVLEMIKGWGADGIVHAGDLDYLFMPLLWLKLIDDVLGAEFPYFVAIGNHDLFNWHDRFGYRHIIEDRLFRTEMEDNCHGEYGVNMTIILSGVGTMGTGHSDFIAGALQQTRSIWKVCAWHKLQHKYQPGHKKDEVGYQVYDMCRHYGAIIQTAHEHSFARTHLMSNFEEGTINSTDFTLDLRPGNTFAFVSGLGGKEIRVGNPERAKDPWWAQIATNDHGISYGALLCTFHVDGNPNHAMCEFRDIDGVTWDRFNLTSTPDPQADKFQAMQDDRPKTEFVEYPITNPRDIFVSSWPLTTTTAKTVNLPVAFSPSVTATTTTILRFRNVRLPANHKLLNAHLQLMGIERPEPHGTEGARSVRITVTRRGTTRQVEWVDRLDEFEPSEVWVSPDLGSLFDDFEAEVETIELEVGGVIEGEAGEGEGAVNVLEAFAWGEEGCLAPTLTWQSIVRE